MPAAVALATCAEHAGLDDEGRLLLGALRERGVVAEPVVWDAEPDGGWERFDLVLRRRDYFLPGPQKLFALTRSAAFRERASELGGYAIDDTGDIRLVN